MYGFKAAFYMDSGLSFNTFSEEFGGEDKNLVVGGVAGLRVRTVVFERTGRA